VTRVAAWRCVRAGSGTPLREVERVTLEAGLDARDKGLVRALVGAEVRRRGTLRALLAHYARGPTSRDLAAHLRLGLTQLFFLDRIPDHAALSETVDAVARTVGFSKKRAANAVLRAALRDRRAGHAGDPRRDLIGRDLHVAADVFRDPAEHPALWAEDALSLPAPLYKRWQKRHGPERARALAEWFLNEPPLCLRGVGVGCGPAELAAELAAAGVETRPGFHPRTLRVASADAEAVLACETFRAGHATLQGESALASAELVGAEPGLRVLDLCAAPGGKTAVLAEAGARVTAVDDDPARVELLRATLARLHLAPAVEVVLGDAADPALPGAFDAVLVDAPCSNTGVLGARPCARWRFSPSHLASLVALQSRLLAAGAARVRPGGRLVWSTCSLEPEENGQLVRRFLAEHGEFELAEEREALPGAGGPADGGYAARLERRG
jgi:16S rRNA (cytosine967-C5)-methyltransferase